jgi:hypothetical protein
MHYLLVVLLLGFIVIPSAYADNGWNIFHDIKKISQGFFESIAISSEQKQSIILQNMAQWQKEKESLINQNKHVPVQFDQIISEKQESLKDTESDNHFLSDIVDSVLVGQELGKIQGFVQEFHKLKTQDIPYSEKSSRINILERDVNQLQLVKRHCTPVSVNALLSVSDPYYSLTNDYCKTLKDIPKPVVMSAIGEH